MGDPKLRTGDAVTEARRMAVASGSNGGVVSRLENFYFKFFLSLFLYSSLTLFHFTLK